jgi:hypothetical protein
VPNPRRRTPEDEEAGTTTVGADRDGRPTVSDPWSLDALAGSRWPLAEPTAALFAVSVTTISSASRRSVTTITASSTATASTAAPRTGS